MPNHSLRKIRPFFLRDECTDFMLNFDGILRCCPSKASRQPAKVGINSNSWNTKCVSEYDVGGLSSHTRQGNELFNSGRNFPIEIFNKFGSEAFEMPCLCMIKTSRKNVLFNFSKWCSRVVFRLLIFFKECWRQGINSLVGALR